MSAETVHTASPARPDACRWCGGSLAGKRADAEFCCDRCRLDWHRNQPPEGVVRGVRKLKTGVSVVIHLPGGPVAERALKLALGESVRIVRGAE